MKLKLVFGNFSKEVDLEPSEIQNIHNHLDSMITDLEIYICDNFEINQDDFYNRFYLE